jgi:two-component system cell cycle sensor histidine kinase/response regulator CckA
LSLLESAPFLSEDSREVIMRAQDACDRGRELTGEIAAFGGAGRKRRRGEVEVGALVEKAAQFALFDSEGLRPVFRIGDGVMSVRGDSGQLRQMVEALASNSVKAMTVSGVGEQLSIEVDNVMVGRSSELPLREGSYVRMSLRDDGPGMNEADLRRVFDPYFSGDGAGRGFGLTKVASTVRLHGGHIDARSQPGEGACFDVYLPAVESGDQAGVSSAKPSPSGMRVLVLDDEPHIRTVLDKALSGAGHEVYCVATGEEAVRAFYKAEDFGRTFDVLLFDLDIRGGMGGRQTLERIRSTHPGVRAIVTTGFVDDEVLENYLEHGFCGVLCKPFRLEHLTAAVERLGGGGK